MATLVDTSVWINHFRVGDSRLIVLLESRELVIHSAVIGELATGSLKKRSQILADLKMIPRIPDVSPLELLEFIEMRKLFGKGLSWVDVHLLASSLAYHCDLLTDDRCLKACFDTF